jgi:hypothetical protein
MNTAAMKILLLILLALTASAYDRKSEQMRRSARCKEMMMLQSQGVYHTSASGQPRLTYYHADGTHNTVPWLRDKRYATHVFVYEGTEGRYRVSVWSEGPTTVQKLEILQ